MIRVIAGLLLGICTVGIALAKEDQSPSESALYVIVDSSGSMARGANWGDVQDLIAQNVGPILATTDVSLNLVGGDFRNCLTPVEIRPAERLDEIELVAPREDASTIVGKSLETAVEQIGESQARILIITDGSEQCTPTLCDAAVALLPNRDNISVQLLFTEDALPADKIRLSCVANAQGLAIESSVDEPNLPSAPVRQTSGEAADQHINLLLSLPWILLLVMFAVSFFMFGRTFSKSHKALEAKFKTVEADVQNDTTELPSTRYRWAGIVFVLAAVGALALLFVPHQVAEEFRGQVQITLNTEFGAAVFLAGLLMLAGFGGSQYWKYAELRREYNVATDAETREKARIARERADRAERRLYESYQRQRTALADRSFALHRYLSTGELDAENTALLSTIVDQLKYLALGDDRSVGKIDQAEVDRISQFNSFLSDRTLLGLIDKLSDDRLPADLKQALRAVLAPNALKSASEQNRSLTHLTELIGAHVTAKKASG